MQTILFEKRRALKKAFKIEALGDSDSDIDSDCDGVDVDVVDDDDDMSNLTSPDSASRVSPKLEKVTFSDFFQ